MRERGHDSGGRLGGPDVSSQGGQMSDAGSMLRIFLAILDRYGVKLKSKTIMVIEELIPM